MENTVLDFCCTGMEYSSKIPIEYTGRGQNLSPEFTIKNLSPDAKTLAITLEDLSHPINHFTHWIVWNIPATDKVTKAIPAGKIVSGNIRQGIGYGFHRYAGPKPPKGRTHTYRFTIYAIDCTMDLSANITKRTFLKKTQKHILQSGSITDEFE